MTRGAVMLYLVGSRTGRKERPEPNPRREFQNRRLQVSPDMLRTARKAFRVLQLKHFGCHNGVEWDCEFSERHIGRSGSYATAISSAQEVQHFSYGRLPGNDHFANITDKESTFFESAYNLVIKARESYAKKLSEMHFSLMDCLNHAIYSSVPPKLNWIISTTFGVLAGTLSSALFIDFGIPNPLSIYFGTLLSLGTAVGLNISGGAEYRQAKKQTIAKLASELEELDKQCRTTDLDI